jgi:hypothetical protein
MKILSHLGSGLFCNSIKSTFYPELDSGLRKEQTTLILSVLPLLHFKQLLPECWRNLNCNNLNPKIVLKLCIPGFTTGKAACRFSYAKVYKK